MKKLTCLLFLIICHFMGTAQRGNTPKPLSDNFNCQLEPRIPGCNFIGNPEFLSRKTTDAFWLNEVSYWTASHGRPDINTSFVAPPTGTNYATFTVGNDQTAGHNLDEGIITRTKQMRSGNPYAFSFYRAFSTHSLPNFSYADQITLKIVLLKCRDIPYQAPNTETSYDVPDYSTIPHQVVYCENLPIGDPPNNWDYWNRFAFKFTADDDYDAVWIFAERGGSNILPDTYNDIHIAYPELIDYPTTVNFTSVQEGCFLKLNEPQLPCLFEGLIPSSLTCYGPNSNVATFGFTSWPIYISLSKRGLYRFVMHLPVDISNNICSDNISEFEIGNINVDCNCDCGIQTMFDCNVPIPPKCSNLVPNPEFKVLHDGLVPNYLHDAFPLGNVIDWGYGSHFTSDINGSGYSTLTPPISGTNFASMLAQNNILPGWVNPIAYGENIVAKIGKVKKGKQYAFSFFLASEIQSPTIGSSFTFKAVLTNCQNFPNAANNLNNITNKQTIFCEPFINMGATSWRQYFVSFVADNDYDMLVVYNDIPPVYTNTLTYVHFAYPQIFNVTDNYSKWPGITNKESCKMDIGDLKGTEICTGSIPNAQYTWTDPLNNIVYQSSTYQAISVNQSLPGYYTLSVNIPGLGASNNTCSDNNPTLTATVFIPPSCDCAAPQTLDIINATAEYYRVDPPSNTSMYLYNQSLSVCADNAICYNAEEWIGIQAQSNMASGNYWEFFSSNPNIIINNGGGIYNPTAQFIYENIGFTTLTTADNLSGIVEFRLTNSITGEVKSFFIKIATSIHYGSFQLNWCNSVSNPGFDGVMRGGNTNDPTFSYTWTFPAGMYVDDPNTVNPHFKFSSYTGPYPVNATVSITNEYCPAYPGTDVISLEPGTAICNAKTTTPNKLVPVVEEKTKESKMVIYPNPVMNTFTVSTSKEIKELIVYGINGKMMKRFTDTKSSSRLFDISMLTRGSYFVVAYYKDGLRETKAIIKQ